MAADKKISDKNGKKTTSQQKKTTEVVKNPYKKDKSSVNKGGATKAAQSAKTASGNKSGAAKSQQSNVEKNKATANKAASRSQSKPAPTPSKVVSNAAAKNDSSKKAIVTKAVAWLLGIIAGAVVIFFIVSLCDPIVYSEFYSSAEKLVEIPGMSEGFVPQGLAYSDDADVYLISGYMQDKTASRVYIVNTQGEFKELRLKNEDGSIYKGHAGGISCSGDDVYISNAGNILHITLTTLLEASDVQYVQFDGGFEVDCSASFTFCDDSMLYVGEFFYDGYDTDDNHIVELSNGERNQAFVYGYPLDENGYLGVKDIDTPTVVYSVRDKVQGFAVTDNGRVVLSCSYGLADSHIYVYDIPESKGSYNLNGKDIPMYILDDSCMKDDVKAPFMSEDVDVVNGDIIVGFESYAPKYGGGMLPFSIKHVMKYSID